MGAAGGSGGIAGADLIAGGGKVAESITMVIHIEKHSKVSKLPI